MNLTVERIKEQVTIVDAAERYGLEPNRKGYVICLFHDEKTASLKLYPETNTFYCFGCGTGGDVINLVRHLFHLDFSQAVRRICCDFGIGMKQNNTGAREIVKIRQKQAQKYQATKNHQEEYMDKISRFAALREIVEFYKPKPSEKPRALFFAALSEMNYIDYWLSENPWK